MRWDQGVARSGFVPVQDYFRKELEPVRALSEKTNMPLDNKELRKQLNERLQALDDALWIKESLLEAMMGQPFTVTGYLKLKAKVTLSLEDDSSSGSSPKAPKEKRERKGRKERTRSSSKAKVEVPTDILYPGALSYLVRMESGKSTRSKSPGLYHNATESPDGDCKLVARYSGSFGGHTISVRREYRNTGLKFWGLFANNLKNAKS